MTVDRNRLIEMMNMYWSVDNNDECAREKMLFCKENGISEEEVFTAVDMLVERLLKLGIKLKK